jgi:hypothetical protein
MEVANFSKIRRSVKELAALFQKTLTIDDPTPDENFSANLRKKVFRGERQMAVHLHQGLTTFFEQEHMPRVEDVPVCLVPLLTLLEHCSIQDDSLFSNGVGWAVTRTKLIKDLGRYAILSLTKHPYLSPNQWQRFFRMVWRACHMFHCPLFVQPDNILIFHQQEVDHILVKMEEGLHLWTWALKAQNTSAGAPFTISMGGGSRPSMQGRQAQEV